MTFAYTESTNIVVATNGTSGTPLTLADFVTADRAGTGTVLLAATAGAANNTLTYAVRPVEDLAILVKCIVASKTAEADYIFITGTDFAGNAQTESIDVTAGDGSYTTTKYWATITNLDCSDNAAGGGTVWADGTIAVTQDVWGVIWDLGHSQYQIDADLDIGDGSTSTYLASEGECVHFDGCSPQVTSAATLRIGSASNDFSDDCSYWRFLGTNWTRPLTTYAGTPTWLIYGSIIRVDTDIVNWNGGDVTIKNSNIITAGTAIVFWGGTSTLTMEGVYLTGISTITINLSATTMENVHVEGATTSFQMSATANTAVSNCRSTNASWKDYQQLTGYTLTTTDPYSTLSSVDINHADGVIIEQFTCNIHVADKDGTNLSGVTVKCEDDAAAQEFSVATDANGDIAEQTIDARTWSGTSETLDDNNPFVFTLSKAGYETLVLENITVDGAIVWHLELQAQKQSPAPWQEGMM